MSQESYTLDEFDNPPAGPVGVHRGPRSLGARLAPYLIVLLVAAVCGLAVWALTGNALRGAPAASQSTSSSVAGGAVSTSEPAASQSGDAQTTASATASQSTSAAAPSSPAASSTTSSPAASTPAASTVNKSSKVVVINGVGRNGYGAQNAAKLKSAGYSNASAANPTNRSTLPDASTVWYQNEADKATAEDVAQRLGIDVVAQSPSVSAPVVAVLMK